MKSALVAHLLGTLVAAPAGLLAAILYLLTQKFLGLGGQNPDGLVAAATIVVFPAANIAFVLLIWIPVQLLWQRRTGLPTPKSALAAGMGLGFVVAMMWAGPYGFTTHPRVALFNYFLIPMFGLGALVDNWFVRRFRRSG